MLSNDEVREVIFEKLFESISGTKTFLKLIQQPNAINN